MNYRRAKEISRSTKDLESERVNPAFPRWIQVHGRRRPRSPAEKQVSFSSSVLRREFFKILSQDVVSDDSSIESRLSDTLTSESSDTDSSDTGREDNDKQISKLGSKRVSSYRRKLLSLVNSVCSSSTSKKSCFKNLSRILSSYRSPVKKRSPITLERISFQLHPRNRKLRHKPNNKRFHRIYEENLRRLISKSMSKHYTMTFNPDTNPRQYQCTLEPVRDTLSSSGAGRSLSRRRDRCYFRGSRKYSPKTQSIRSETRSRSPSPEIAGVRKRIPIKRSEENAVGDRESVTTRRRRKPRNGTVPLSRKPSETSRRSTDSCKDQSEHTPPPSRCHSSAEVARSFRDDNRAREVCEGEASATKPRPIKEKRRVKKIKMKSLSSTQTINYKQNDSDNAEKNDSCPTIKPNRMKKKLKIKIPDYSLSMVLQELVKNRINHPYPYSETKGYKEENTNIFPEHRRAIFNNLAKRRYGRETKIADLIASFADTHTKRGSTENVFGTSEVRSFDGSENFGDSKNKGNDYSPSETESTVSTRQKRQRIKNPSESSVAPKVKIRKKRTANKETQDSLFPESYKKTDAAVSTVELPAEDLNRNNADKDSVSSTNLKYDNAKTENSQKRLRRRSSATSVAREKLMRSIRENGAPRKQTKSQNAASKKESGDSVGRRSRLPSRQSKEQGEVTKQMVAPCSQPSRRGRRGESTGEESRPKTESGTRPKSQGNKLDKSSIPVPRIPRRRPPKGYLTFEQVVGSNPPQPAEQLSWEALVNARDENGVSPVGLLRLKRRRRRRRLLTPRNSGLKAFPSMDLTRRKRSAAMADALEVAARRLVVRQRLGIEKPAVRETSPPSRRKKRNRARSLMLHNTIHGGFYPAFPIYRPFRRKARRKW